MDGSLRVLIGEGNPRERKLMERLLADAGLRYVRGEGDGASLLAALEERPDLLVLAWDLVAEEDFVVVRRLRETKGVRPPVLVLLAAVDERKLVQAHQLGLKHFLVKPFSREALERKMEEALGGLDAARAEAEEASQRETRNSARKNFLQGLNFLGLRQFDQALGEFAKAVKLHALFPEAYKGIAESFKGKGDVVRCGQFLSKAAETHVRLEQDDDAAELYAEILKAYPDSPNPFKTVADELKGQGRAEEALRKYERARAIAPRDPAIIGSMSKTYLEAGDKEKALEALKPMLGAHEISDEFAALFQEITGQDFYSSEYFTSSGKQQQFLDEEAERRAWIEKRACPRVQVADFSLTATGVDDLFSVVDLSLGGIAFKAQPDQFQVGQRLVVDVASVERTRMRKMPIEVRHIDRGVCGCQFIQLTPKHLEVLKALCATPESVPSEGGED